MVLVTLVLASSVTAVSAVENRGSWSFTGANGDPLRPTGLSLTVDVFGPMAVGTVVQEFRNDGRDGVTVSFKSPDLSGWRLATTEIEVAGRKIETSAQARPSASRQTRPRAGRGDERSTLARASAATTVGSGETAIARSRFEQTLLLEGGMFHLRVPGIGARVEGGEAVAPSLELTLHHAEPPSIVRSPSHEILVSEEGTRTVVELAHGQALGRKPFELLFSAGLQQEPTLIGYVGPEKGGDRQLVAVLTPPETPASESIRPKRMVFVVDTSGSMAPMDKLNRARQALQASLRELGANDRFNVVEFDHDHSVFRPEPVAASKEMLDAAEAWLKGLRAQGATRLLPALEAAFAQPQDDERHGMLVVFTDGIVHDAREVEAFLREKVGQSRLFFVGIGKDVEREQVFRFAEIGRGTAAFADEAESIGSTLAVLFSSISQPLVWDLEVDWGGADVRTVRPQPLPDLYGGRPVTLYAEIHGAPPAELKLRGRTVEGERVFTVVLPTPE